MLLTHAYYVLWSLESLAINTKFSEWTLDSENNRRWGGGYSIFNKWPHGYGSPAIDIEIPAFDCLTVQHPNLIYSPDKVDEYVIAPQVKTSEPSVYDYRWNLQNNQQQILKNAIGSDFIYQLPLAGIKYSDNFRQRLETLNALRHLATFMKFDVNVKQYYRRRVYDSSGQVTGDTGIQITDKEDGYMNGRMSNHEVNVSQIPYSNPVAYYVSERTELYYTFDIDFNASPYINGNSLELMDNTKFYMEKSYTYVPQLDDEYDKEILTMSDGASYEFKAPAPPHEHLEGGYARCEYGSYRYSTSLKEMTMEDLANHYQVPY